MTGSGTVYVDADACPVRDETVRVAARHGWAVLMVCQGGIRPGAEAHVRLVVVEPGADAADRWIAARIGPGDVCITTDIVLAAACIARGARVLGPTGAPLTGANIGPALAMRDLAADLRAAAPLGTGGGARPFAKADRSRFLDQLDRMLRQRPGA